MTDETRRIGNTDECGGTSGTRRVGDAPPVDGTAPTRRVAETPASPAGTLRIDAVTAAPTRAKPRLPLGQLAAGTVLCGEYTVVETIAPHERRLPGVYLCAAPGGEHVVLKVAAVEFPPDRALWDRLPALTHPNVLRVLRVLEDDGFFYEVQTYCDGGTLDDLIPPPGASSALTEPQLRQLVRQLVDALGYLHGQGIVHRDLKPRNIFLARAQDGGLMPVLGDFDISSLLDTTRTSRTTSRAGGTWIYTAPESFPRFMDETGHIGAQITRAGDYYALGISLLELMMGTTSLHTCGLSDLYDFYLQGNHVAVPDNLPPALAMLLRGLLIINRHTRWGAAEVSRWLADSNAREDLDRINADHAYRMQRAARPYRMGERVAYDLHGLAEIMLTEQEIALDDLLSGDMLVYWIGEQDTNVARDVRRLREWWRQQPRVALWSAALCCDPRHPFRCVDGAPVATAGEWLRHTAQLAAQGQATVEQALSNEALTGLEVWLNLKTDPEPALAERIAALRDTPAATRLEEVAYLLHPERPFAIDAAHAARTPAEFVALAYGKDGDWKIGIPPVYHAAMQRWRDGALAAWLRQRGLAAVAAQAEEIRERMPEHPAAVFETLLRLLDPDLPPVQVALDAGAMRAVRRIPFGIIRRFAIPFKTIGPGMPFATFQAQTDTEEATLEDTLVSRRTGQLAVIIDIDQEPFDCNIHHVALSLDGGFTRLAGERALFRYRMVFPGIFTALYVGLGALLGLLGFLLPRLLAEAAGTALDGPSSAGRWYLVAAVFLAEVLGARALWMRAMLQPSESRRLQESQIRAMRGLLDGLASANRSETGDTACLGVVAAVVVFFASLGYLMRFLVVAADGFFSAAHRIPLPLPLLWALWGMLIGAALGFWHVAPLYNLLRARPWIIAGIVLLPFLLFLLGLIGQ